MTLEELLKKNAVIKAARERAGKKEEKIIKPAVEEKVVEQPIVEENKIDEVVEAEESKRENEEAVVEKPKKRGKKPANREYMVVEDNKAEELAEENVEEAAEIINE